ncbi:MAG: DUF2341 domain-containing protein [Verrucomicrobia bacterium]|nr:DUF2341 domain-containing protein [Verrucomicrobiota bacterium]
MLNPFTLLFPRTRQRLRFTLLLFTFLALATESHAWWNPAWTVRKKITIDPAAGSIAEPIGTTVVLVRLYEGNFQFGSAREDGSDIRFVAADDKTPLKFHLERFDGLLYEAYAWVRLPDLKPGAPITFWIYSGNASESMTGGGDSKTTYDPETLLVYHFSDSAGAAPTDATSGAHNAESPGLPVTSAAIAGGVRLTGLNAISIPLAPDLASIEGSPATISLWIKPTLFAPNAPIFTRRDADRSLVLGLDNGVPYAEVTTPNGTVRTPASPPLELNAWRHLALTIGGGKLTLWVNGESVSTIAGTLPTLNSPILLGKEKSPDASAEKLPAFVGEIDELHLSKIVRPAGALKLSALTEGGGEKTAKMVTFGEEEATKTESESELGKQVTLIKDISKSLTFDGWVVIGLCALLASIGGIVAITKFLYLRKIKQASNAFLLHWEKVSGNLHILDGGDESVIQSMAGKISPKEIKILRQSPLYNLYQIGFSEVQDRLATARENFQGLSGRSMQAIKATLDGGLVRQVQKLNSNLIFLTIGIAGGPYLGLLGTVIGVMITFAVEVNSIAPGIAGALLATVAGLAVAIPALFAYSYLSSQIKDAISDMQVFIDEMVTKIAEFYSEPNR